MAVLFTLLLTGVLSAVFIMLLGKNQESQDAAAVRIGVTGAIEDSYFKAAMRLIEDIDTAQFSLEIQMMASEQEAKAMLREGKLTGYVIIPESFVDSIITGENKTVQYVSTGGQIGIGTLLTREVLSVISSLVTESQSGIYGMHAVYYQNGLKEILLADERELNIRYIRYILRRGELFTIEQSVMGEVSFVEYYTCGIWLLLLLLWGISCSPLFFHKNRELQRLLVAKGVPVWAQIAGEYTAYLLLMVGSLFLVVTFVLTGSVAFGYSFENLFPCSGGVRGFLWGSIPVMLLVSALEYLLYELTDGFLDGILLQFFCAIVMGYISGCFLPIQSLPESISRISPFLPVGMAMSYLGDFMSGEHEAVQISFMVVYGALLLLAAVGIRKYHLYSGKGQT